MEDETQRLMRDHYRRSFGQFGTTSQGVDWGASEENHLLRLSRLANVMGQPRDKPVSVLDVGCGFGALRQMLDAQGRSVDFTGIDLVDEMVDAASERWPADRWVCADFLGWEPGRTFDFVIANGVLTQKLTVSHDEMDQYCTAIIRKMLSCADVAISFNVMTKHANYYADNLYYRDPGEMLDWCIKEFSPRVALDHSYGLYEFTVYVFR